MKNKIKYIMFFVFVFSLFAYGFWVYANENIEEKNIVACTMEAKLCPDGVTYVGRVGPNCEFEACPMENRNDSVKNRIDEKKEQQKNRIESMVESVKNQREEFRREFEIRKEEAKTKAEQIRNKFKEDLEKIKDEKKKLSVEKIVEIIKKLNNKFTDNLSERVNKIENVLVGIESRINKAEDRGLDVVLVKKEVEKAKVAIGEAREAISIQALKTYEINITTEENLRIEMKRVRDLFKSDIKTVYEKVKIAHMAVKNTAVFLAKIPNINDESNLLEDN